VNTPYEAPDGAPPPPLPERARASYQQTVAVTPRPVRWLAWGLIITALVVLMIMAVNAVLYLI